MDYISHIIVACFVNFNQAASDEPVFMKWLLKPLMLGRALADMDRMETFLQEKCQDLDFTSVRPPQLTNGDEKGTYITMAFIDSLLLSTTLS